MTDASSSWEVTAAAGNGSSHRGPGAVSIITTPPRPKRQATLRMTLGDARAEGGLVAAPSPTKEQLKYEVAEVTSQRDWVMVEAHDHLVAQLAETQRAMFRQDEAFRTAAQQYEREARDVSALEVATQKSKSSVRISFSFEHNREEGSSE